MRFVQNVYYREGRRDEAVRLGAEKLKADAKAIGMVVTAGPYVRDCGDGVLEMSAEVEWYGR